MFVLEAIFLLQFLYQIQGNFIHIHDPTGRKVHINICPKRLGFRGKVLRDPDTLIINTAIELADNFATAIFIGKDTDLLILLTVKAPNLSNIYIMKLEKGTTRNTFYSSKYSNFSSIVKHNILLLHAISECDTTSALYYQGMLKFDKLLERNTTLQETVKVFHFEDADYEVLISAESAAHSEYGFSRDPHPCRRTCSRGGAPMTCQYTFEVEYYLTMSKACYDCPFNITDCYRPDCIPGDGNKRGVVSVNRKMPGPTLEVCLGDRIVVDVVNKMSSESTTMHWHGQQQRESSYSDGVPYVTQCPTLPHDTFRYDFNASQPGTHWYHSHAGMQRADGNFGALIVRVPSEDNTHAALYDYDLSSHIVAESVVFYSGERFDIVVNANQEKGLYWIRAKGLQDCGEEFSKVFQVAVLHYNGSNATVMDYPEGTVDFDNAHHNGTQINGINIGGRSNRTFITIPDLQSTRDWDESLNETADFKYYIAFDYEGIDNSEYQRAPYYGYNDFTDEELRRQTPQINHITMKIPNFALLPQRDQIPDGLFCNRENMADQNCTTRECQCYHGIKVPLNAVVELFFIDEASSTVGNHPMHLHGHTFRVVGMEKLGNSTTLEEVQRRDELGLIERNLVDAPLKDTVTVPAGGYTVIRFRALNPGFWILHCHLEFHAEMGMAMIIQEGEIEDMLPVPINFPTCGDYIPDL